MDPTYLSAVHLAELTRTRKIGCLELLDHYIARVERLDPKINAVVVHDFDRARQRARQLDSSTDRSAPLFGVPMTVKESFDVAVFPPPGAYRRSEIPSPPPMHWRWIGCWLPASCCSARPTSR